MPIRDTNGQMVERANVHAPRIVNEDDWRRCREIARTHGRTFYFASRFMSPDRRRSIHAVYAYCRIADDIVDHASRTGLDAAARALNAWESQLAVPTHPIALAFAAARDRYGVPLAAASDLIAGLRMDLSPRRYATWDELREYCYGVAGTVGLLTAPILGCQDDAALPHAVNLGIAMQLTNVLRDIAEDAENGRLYLPIDDLTAFDCDPDSILAGRPNGAFCDLLAFEIDRARGLYADGRHGIPALSFAGRLTTLAASDLYAKILTRIEEQKYDVFAGRASISTPRKLRAMPGIAAASLGLTLPSFAARSPG